MGQTVSRLPTDVFYQSFHPIHRLPEYNTRLYSSGNIVQRVACAGQGRVLGAQQMFTVQLVLSRRRARWPRITRARPLPTDLRSYYNL